MMTRYSFRGRDQVGRNISGSIDLADVTEFVETLYISGWRELFVTDTARNLVGGVGAAVDGGRKWWAIDSSILTIHENQSTNRCVVPAR